MSATPRDEQVPDALATVKGGKPMVGTLGNGLRLFHMARWSAGEEQLPDADLLAFLGLDAPVTLANAEASAAAAAVLDSVFYMMHALATTAAAAVAASAPPWVMVA